MGHKINARYVTFKMKEHYSYETSERSSEQNILIKSNTVNIYHFLIKEDNHFYNIE